MSRGGLNRLQGREPWGGPRGLGSGAHRPTRRRSCLGSPPVPARRAKFLVGSEGQVVGIGTLGVGEDRNDVAALHDIRGKSGSTNSAETFRNVGETLRSVPAALRSVPQTRSNAPEGRKSVPLRRWSTP